MGTQSGQDFTREQYWAEFGYVAGSNANGDYPKDTKIAKAYEVALDIRKFEIDLYWKRSNSFWLFAGGLAAALGLILGGKISSDGMLSHKALEIVCFALCCAGSVVSLAWCFANRASKNWQRNWEFQVGVLERAVVGPLYTTVLFKDSKSNTWHHSLSDLNFWTSVYIFCLFFSGALYFSEMPSTIAGYELMPKVAIAIAHAIFVGILVVKSTTKTSADLNNLDVILKGSRRELSFSKMIKTSGKKPAPADSSVVTDKTALESQT